MRRSTLFSTNAEECRATLVSDTQRSQPAANRGGNGHRKLRRLLDVTF